jgi:DNA-binding CsgD family transcriptional regulator/tetratricopeptide (TPR) repeat protein
MELLERAPFLQTLAEYVSEARQGNGRLVLLSGGSGMGKTVLLEEFQRRAGDARWLWGSCDGLLTPRPLGPLFDIGAQLDSDRATSQASSHPASTDQAGRDQTSTDHSTPNELAALCRQGAPRDQLFAAFLAELAAPSPFTIVVIEDVHWADEATADLLSLLGRRLGRIPALLLVSYRDDELAADHPLRVVLGDLATQRATRRMRLPPLSEDAVAALAAQAAIPAPRDVDAAELHRVTGGNPFYVSEILDAGWPSIPPTVRDAVGARLARATPGARRVVETAAVIGGRVDLSLLSAALTGSGSATELDECLDTGILVPDGAALRFRHELVRMAVEAGIAPHRRAGLHARLLAALDRDGADPTLLAHHAEGAGDAAAVRRHAPEAARRSAALGAHREAAAHYERALRFTDDGDRSALAALREGLAGEYALLDRWEEAEQALRTALALRRAAGDTLAVGEDLRRLSSTLWRLCRGPESDVAAHEAVTVLETLPIGPELAWAYANLGAGQLTNGQIDEGIATLDRARDLAEQLGETEVVSFALNTIGCALVIGGREDGRGQIKQALDLALEADLPEAAGRAYLHLHEFSVGLNEFALSERYYTEGLAYSEGREMGVFSACLLGWRSCSLMLQGRWDEAAEMAGQMLGWPHISPINRLNPLRVLGVIRGRRGDDSGGWKLLDESLEPATRLGEPAWLIPLRTARAELHWLAGRTERALTEAATAFAVAPGQVDPWTTGAAAIWLPRLNPSRAADLPASLPEPYRLEAAGDWQAAARQWDDLGRPYDAALTRLFSGDEAGLREALTAFDELGAQAPAAVARRQMRERGLRAIPRGPRAATKAAPAGLTAREQEVLVLVSEGLADREISERLFISERTVNHHVSALLAKIGVSSRTAAAREAARMGLEPAD